MQVIVQGARRKTGLAVYIAELDAYHGSTRLRESKRRLIFTQLALGPEVADCVATAVCGNGTDVVVVVVACGYATMTGTQ
jgi:hypothetical protein